MCAAKKLDPHYRDIIQRWRDSFDCLYKDWAVLTEIPKVFFGNRCFKQDFIH